MTYSSTAEIFPCSKAVATESPLTSPSFGDGIPNDIDSDIDGDGITNEDDDTISGFLFISEVFPSSIEVFPNPSIGVLNIKSLDKSLYYKYAQIIIKDLKGDVVFNKNMQLTPDTKLNVDFLSNSVYVLQVYINRSVFSKNIIIKN